MPNRPTNLPRRRIHFWTCLPILLISFVSGRAQAIKLNELPDLIADDTQAHLDLFAKRLLYEPQATGVFVAYYPENWPPGFFLRHIHGYADYLVNKRGIVADRLSVLVGGAKEKFLIEMWLLPPGSSAPSSSATTLFQFDKLTQFDGLSFGPDCESQYTLTLEEPGDAFRFFASALRQNAIMKGLVLVHPWRYQNDPQSRSLVNSIPKLVKEHSIPSDRLILEVASEGYCGGLQLWVVPPGFVVPKGQTARVYLHRLLMNEADNRYSIRRVEFVGNRYTRDDVLRRRVVDLKEGEIFRTEILRQSLANVSKLSIIRPIRMSDVEVRLNRAELTIDLTLYFRERPSARRQLRGRR
jgi:hypothetical protein